MSGLTSLKNKVESGQVKFGGGGGGKDYFGPVVIDVLYLDFTNAGNGVKAEAVTEPQWEQLDDSVKGVQLSIDILTQQMEPSAPYNVEGRKVPIGGVDWFKIFLPSLAEAGLIDCDPNADEAHVKALEALDAMNGKYVHMAGVPQVKNKNFDTLKVVKVFADEAECKAAYKERWGGTSTASSTGGDSEYDQILAKSCPAGTNLGDWAKQIEGIRSYYVGQGVTPNPAQVKTEMGITLEQAMMTMPIVNGTVNAGDTPF